MTHPTGTSGSFRLSRSFKRGAAFAFLSLCVFVLLMGVARPHWATAWLVASVFTFAIWRMGREPQR
jgi:hypothetical protein